MTALLPGAVPTLKATDLLQDREAAYRSLAAFANAAVAMATCRDDTVGARASVDLSKGDLQTGQWVFSVLVLLSVVPVTEVTEVGGAGEGRRCVGRKNLSLCEPR